MSIDLYYMRTVKTLTKNGTIKNLSDELKLMTDNAQRVLYILNHLKSMDNFPQLIVTKKTESVSTHYRNLGNTHFIKQQNHKAWQYYNLSLLNSPLDSENYCISLSNRSAVFLALGKYDECLIDIKKLLSLNYPPFLKDKLIKRQAQCEEKLKSMKDSEKFNNSLPDFFSINSPRHNKYPCASNKIDVVTDPKMGRMVVAMEDIKVGEVLALENPYLTVLLKNQFLFCCNYCISWKLNLMPCDTCCFALYCSSECKEKAFEEYHEIECPLLASLIKMKFTKLELLALRITIKARRDHSDWESLFKTVKEAEANMNSDLRGCVCVDGEWIYDSKYYASIHTLATNIEKRSISDIYQKCVTAAVFYDFLEKHTSFMNSDVDEERKNIANFVAGTLLLHIMTSPTNMHGISTNLETEDGNFVEELSIASASYAFLSLLNHSCAPNVVRFCELGCSRMRLFALRPIKKGMQLFDNYGSHHATDSRSERQSDLMFQYKFRCDCEACINDWPTYFNLNLAPNLPKKISNLCAKLLNSETMENLQKGSSSLAVDLCPKLCDLAEALEPYSPCRELADCQETLKQCIILCLGAVSRHYRDSVDWDVKATGGSKTV